MARAGLEEILKEVKTLSLVDQRALRDALDDLLPVSAPQDTNLQTQLQQAGLLQKINPPIEDLTPYKNRKPVKLKRQGKTASEVIIEERR